MVTRSQPNTSLGIVGVGEVGLRLALAFADAGYDVVCVDVDEDRIQDLRDGRSYIRDVDDSAVEELNASGTVVSTEYDVLSTVSHVAVCVPTPLQKSGQPDVSYVVDAMESLRSVLEPGSTIIVESTVYPGATANLIRDVLEETGFTVGEDVHLAFSPERVNPGDSQYDFVEIPKVLGGVTPACADHTQAVYETVFDRIVRVSSSTEAEMTKILENTFRNVNIALVNELVKVADNLDIDFWNVIEAAETKPYGFMPFYPGPGLGGHCIPVDPLYLSWRAKEDGLDTPLIDLADKTNREMSEYIVTRLTTLLNRNHVPLPEATILILGVAYKPNVPDVRNAPALDIMELLSERGAEIKYHDPHIDAVTVDTVGEFRSEPLDSTLLSSVDCAVVLTDHDRIDIDSVVERAPLVFDTRNATASMDDSHVHRL